MTGMSFMVTSSRQMDDKGHACHISAPPPTEHLFTEQPTNMHPSAVSHPTEHASGVLYPATVHFESVQQNPNKHQSTADQQPSIMTVLAPPPSTALMSPVIRKNPPLRYTSLVLIGLILKYDSFV